MKNKNLSWVGALFVFALLLWCTAVTPGKVADPATYTCAVYSTFFSLLPPVIAIVLALNTKEVYTSLLVGIASGALLYANGNLELALNTLFFNEVGGMIRRETYEWMEPILEEAEREGARVISVSHHNLLDESGVSRSFYDNCTIEHNEELVRMLSDHGVRLHLSGHLHIQHYKEDEDTGIYEIVTGSMVMAPCHYGIVRIWNDGTYQYDAKSVDVDGWAIRHSYHNRDLADFTAYSESILRRAAIRDAIRDLNRHIEDRHAFFTDEKKREMASYYADLCVNYYEGRMYQIEEAAKENPVLEDWNKIGYVSELSDFLQNILEDEAKDYGHLKIPSVH